MRRQSGVALITVLLVVALVTVICAALIMRQQLAIRSIGNQLLVRQAQYYAEGGELLAKALLRRDLKAGRTDYLGEPWANPQLSFPLDEGGELRLHIEDLSGRFNLNALADTGEMGNLALQRFQRLLLILQVRPVYAELLRDWLDTDQDPIGPNGAEDALYLLADPAYRTGPGQIAEVSELRLLLGMTESEYQRLAPYVTALPSNVGINVNTASAQVLACLGDGIAPASLQSLIEGRIKTGFQDVGSFAQQLSAFGVSDQGLSVASEYFRVTTEVLLGDRRQVLASYLQRNEEGRILLMGRDLGREGLAPAPEEDSER